MYSEREHAGKSLRERVYKNRGIYFKNAYQEKPQKHNLKTQYRKPQVAYLGKKEYVTKMST